MTGPDRTTEATETTPFDVVTLGETMVAFVSRDDTERYVAIPAGAESNVAVGVARLEHTARWVSRLGDDRLGRDIAQFVEGEGVSVVAARDPDRPTGVMVKHVTGSGTTSRYYRSGSAASALSIADVDQIGDTRWLHLTGITPALSSDAARLVEHLLTTRRAIEKVSFDVNLRPVLWPSPGEATDTLRRLASLADVVFVGDDEAEHLLGTADPDAVAEAIGLDGHRELVLKRGANGASLITITGVAEVTGLEVPVLDPTGAGDAFAAGYISASLRGWGGADRLRLGNLLGSRVVGVLEDVTPRWSSDDLDRLSPEWLTSLWDSP
jgi:2-dehydro-3-deoxygluconokinase